MIKYHNMMTHGGVEVKFHAFVPSTLGGGERLHSSVLYTRRKETARPIAH